MLHGVAAPADDAFELPALVNTTQPDRESDAALVARFVRLRDERAFGELMRRHGPMVLGVSLRMLKNRQDAEDALQAVFVTLSAKARSLRRYPSLAGWLHNVAVRISLNLLRMNRRREQALRKLQTARTEPDEIDLHELRDLLDEELRQLPARLKEAVILRDLEGYSRNEAAGILGVPPGTIDSRLSRGRKLLHDRLLRRGVTVGASGLAAAITGAVKAAELPTTLVEQTVRIARLFSAGRGTEGLAAATKITSLAQGALTTMFLTRLSSTVCILALAAALVLGAGPLSALVGARPDARAQSMGFLDDFENGSATDNSPVSWELISPWSNATLDASSGDLVLQSLPGTTRSVVAVVRDHFLFNTSIQARVSVNGVNDGILLGARGDTSIGAYWGGVSSSGVLQITKSRPNEYHVLRSTSSNLVPTNGDVVIQFDVIGNELSLFAWRPGEMKPVLPQLQATDNEYTRGITGLIWDTPALGSTTTIRYFHVANSPIPEPSSVVLGSLGFIALAGFVCRTRFLRLRRSA
jgi:RNA polymerase sigma factor (sigma-70 family)